MSVGGAHRDGAINVPTGPVSLSQRLDEETCAEPR
jgi:hypothetical protein